MGNYDVAAYFWPAFTGDDGRSRIFWPDGNGEWETVAAAEKRFEGHSWPRKPVWGYVNEADPNVMEMEIAAAKAHGVNVFIYDWYMYDNRPYLENCLNDGFLKARNRSLMKFYIMWANHDVTYGWDRRIADVDTDTVVWSGMADERQFEKIGKRWIEKYFTLPEYYKIDGKPVLSIYDLQNFIAGLGGLENAVGAMNWLDREAKKSGLPGVHFQHIKYGTALTNKSGFDKASNMENTADVIRRMPFDSLTHYQFVHFTKMGRDYNEILADVFKEWENIDKNFDIPYYPHISIGWDNTPRYKSHIKDVTTGNSPQAFESALTAAREYADKHNVSLITLNSWNEWTETSYLQPDDLNGYGYLEAVKKVFK